jgi:hypothetical protein
MRSNGHFRQLASGLCSTDTQSRSATPDPCGDSGIEEVVTAEKHSSTIQDGALLV